MKGGDGMLLVVVFILGIYVGANAELKKDRNGEIHFKMKRDFYKK